MVRAVVFPGICSDGSLPEQDFTPPADALEGAYVDFMAEMLPKGPQGRTWPDRTNMARYGLFSTTNRPVVMEENGKQFVRFNNGGLGTSFAYDNLSNTGSITRFIRFRFPDGNPSGHLMSVRGNGGPSIYIGSAGYVTVHRGTSQVGPLVPVNDGQWHNVVAVFNEGGQGVVSVDGVDKTVIPGTGSEAVPIEPGFTLSYWNGQQYPGRVLDIARCGQYQAHIAERDRIFAALNAS